MVTTGATGAPSFAFKRDNKSLVHQGYILYHPFSPRTKGDPNFELLQAHESRHGNEASRGQLLPPLNPNSNPQTILVPRPNSKRGWRVKTQT